MSFLALFKSLSHSHSQSRPNLLIVFPVISSVVFLSVRLSLIAVEFGLSFQLLSRSFPFRYDDGEGGRWKSEKEGEEAGKHALLIKLQI
jgi:hypothetical protein